MISRFNELHNPIDKLLCLDTAALCSKKKKKRTTPTKEQKEHTNTKTKGLETLICKMKKKYFRLCTVSS